jgi:hypothetical protein
MKTEKDAERLWREAKSFEELCELNAQFIEGEIDFSPTYGASSLDEESKPLLTYLAALSRAGILTTCSQPGEDHGHSKQRAYLDGLVLKETAERLDRLSMTSDLYIMTTEPGHYKGCMMPITIDEFRPHSWGGAASLDDETGIFTEVLGFKEYCSESAMQELSEAWEVCVIDLCWGRERYLWDVLANEFCVMLNPHEGWLALGMDWPFPEKK